MSMTEDAVSGLGAAERRDEASIRRRWPSAAWMPWEKPPVGRRVRMHGGGTGVVQGAYRTVPQNASHCTTCTCKTTPPFDGWWIVKWDVPIRPEEPGSGHRRSARLYLGHAADAVEQSVEYPPSLAPVEAAA